MNTTFSCVGCGKCCNDHHVPLTLEEARMWANDGGQVIVLVEGFLGNGLGLPLQQREHAERRSAVVRSGESDAYVAITFAAYNAGRCRNLDEDNLCRIYERRPLVCRIYPMEINPHIPLNTAVKECPPESWEKGPDLIVGGELVDQELAGLIHRSRQADRDEIQTKDAICALLGIRTTALKGDGFTAYLPDMTAFATTLDEVIGQTLPEWGSEWQFHLSGEDVAGQVLAAGAEVAREMTPNYAFISLRAA
ncbi:MULTISPECIES: YkgJ family cysteine cluster protein [unclassified Pseudomonas]|uniref:YkgJ family cysteine cluster protein n=1 Tax=unclassified Pseudomonas TaxID=196821 RepID=UPI001390EC0F|nr:MULTISPECIES: YkgJ family cysteine cluster protein [unclassified Pseudomonas]MBH1967797.1 YkgJ family cysteine cluster protein [Pseudomonadales bacterium]KAI2691763.1 YkgJ family cysteine cluster protein [Pseudomonas sp. TNT3]MBF4558542.1 YkgJ family cysteine cluster protein [Pseudomonas sp. p50(2008)]MBH2036041.1 YkgJ family cysteine cluster protein [Pseudomonadales bacterium]MBH2076621.1 YkgJ family cysteine cluster protein [Pseudomonadales bacterium]